MAIEKIIGAFCLGVIIGTIGWHVKEAIVKLLARRHYIRFYNSLDNSQ